jgi:hypothetical protein
VEVIVLNVRCCCQPQKILGRLPVPKQALEYGYWRVPTMSIGAGLETHIIEVRKFNNGHYGQEIAVYSDDRPVEFWRGIPGFIEAPA